MTEGRILLVEDDESIRSMLSDYFLVLGYDVKTAHDGEDALKKFVPGAFDCVISDLFMPTTDGIELLKRIKNQDRDVFYFIMTGFPRIDGAVNAMKEGAYDYITKPFHLGDIRMKVERAISVKKTEAALKKVKGLFLSLTILLLVLVGLGIIFCIFSNGN